MKLVNLIPLCLLLVACNNKATSVQKEESDSSCEEIEEESFQKTVVSLPDTVYPSATSVKYKVLIEDTGVSGELSGFEDLYADAPGAFTFRKGSKRDADFGGVLDSVPSRIEVDWSFSTVYDTVQTKYGRWGGGTGWTGQPLYICWPDSCMRKFVASPARHEIIFGSLDRNVYFLDYDTGKESRTPIPVENPVKGTPSLDPSLNGNLYVGHGVPALGDFGALVIDLYSERITDFYGKDDRARRGWGAYDSSPIRIGQFLFRPGENGLVYKFCVKPGKLVLHSTLSYTVDGRAPGIEASMSAYRNYGYIADNAGNIICMELNTLKPVWRYKLPDDADATPVVSEEENGVFLYVGCEVEHEGVTEASFVKLNALTGQEIWINSMSAQRMDKEEKHFDGGYYSTPLLGRGDCNHLIFENLVENLRGQNGKFIAYERKTGSPAYSVDLRCYAWSSPVGFLDPDNTFYVFTADCSGHVYLFRGKDGKLLVSSHIGGNFESSPVVVKNSVVIGSRGNKIYKLSIK